MAIAVVMVGVFRMVLDGADLLLAPLFLLPFLRICPSFFPEHIDTGSAESRQCELVIWSARLSQNWPLFWVDVAVCVTIWLQVWYTTCDTRDVILLHFCQQTVLTCNDFLFICNEYLCLYKPVLPVLITIPTFPRFTLTS